MHGLISVCLKRKEDWVYSETERYINGFLTKAYLDDSFKEIFPFGILVLSVTHQRIFFLGYLTNNNMWLLDVEKAFEAEGCRGYFLHD